MALAAGARIGSYEIVAPLGAGGMGEVYRARDTKLHRDVALKLLPEALARDPDRLARLTREAQVLAALNHPHIAQIYGFEDSGDTHALVMELVEGPTLADVMSSHAAAGGRIPLPDALHVAREIADALEAAHERGIIHRDLKPANVALQSADGATDIQSCRIKVLDFGLAKAVDASGATPWSPSDSPTKTSPALTEMGVILGTAAYMSPEQARGRAVDRRADIWAFGVVLFETLAGQQPFRGEDVSDTLANVLKREPDWDALPADVPARVRQVLGACLQKSMKARLADMQDVRLALDGAFETPAAAHAGPPGQRTAWMIAAAAAGAIAARFRGRRRLLVGRASARRVARRHACPSCAPSSRAITFPGRPGRSIALSPDGTEIVYVALARDAGTPGSRQQLELRTLNSRAVTDLQGRSTRLNRFFSRRTLGGVFHIRRQFEKGVARRRQSGHASQWNQQRALELRCLAARRFDCLQCLSQPDTYTRGRRDALHDPVGRRGEERAWVRRVDGGAIRACSPARCGVRFAPPIAGRRPQARHG